MLTKSLKDIGQHYLDIHLNELPQVQETANNSIGWGNKTL